MANPNKFSVIVSSEDYHTQEVWLHVPLHLGWISQLAVSAKNTQFTHTDRRRRVGEEKGDIDKDVVWDFFPEGSVWSLSRDTSLSCIRGRDCMKTAPRVWARLGPPDSEHEAPKPERKSRHTYVAFSCTEVPTILLCFPTSINPPK